MPVCSDCGEDDEDETFLTVDGETLCSDCVEDFEVEDFVDSVDGEVQW